MNNEDIGQVMGGLGMLSNLAKIPAIANILKSCGIKINDQKPKAEQNKSTNSGVSADKVNAAFEKLPEKDGKIDLTKIDHKTVMEVANEVGLNDSERLYLAALIAYQNPNYSKGYTGKGKPTNDDITWCNAFAADVLYLWSGSTDLMGSWVDGDNPEKYGNFVDPTVGGWTITTANSEHKEDQKRVLNNKTKFKEVTGGARSAQDLANKGKFVVGFDDGHIAIVMAGDGVTNKTTGVFFPFAAQAGNNNFVNGVEATATRRNGTTYTKSEWSFANSWGADDYANVKFYEFIK